MKLLHGFSRQNRVKFFTHLLVITIIFVLPELMMSYSRPFMPLPHTLMLYFKTLMYVVVFYVDYALIIDRTLLARKRRVWTFIGWNLLLIAAVLAITYTLSYFVFGDGGMRPGPRHRPHPQIEIPYWRHMLWYASFMHRDIVMIALTIALSVALKLSENWSEFESRKEQLIASQRADELQSLKSQLNPHFLFNTLNTIYALIAVAPAEAQDAIHKLSGLLRYVLYENPATVTLRQEIDFARNYISLMEIRHAPGTVKSEFADEAHADIEVAPLLFITLIENAFKHGNTGVKDQPIEISITTDADGNVACRTFNHFVHKADSCDSAQPGGIGIANLRRRLQLLYGDRASLDIKVEADTYTAVLTIKTNPDL